MSPVFVERSDRFKRRSDPFQRFHAWPLYKKLYAAGRTADNVTNYFYIPSKSGPGIITVRHDPKSDLRFSRGPGGADLPVEGLPILKPPCSRITALDLNTGEFAWVVPLVTTPARVSQNPAIKGINLPNTGGINLHATLLVTKTLLMTHESPSLGLRAVFRTSRYVRKRSSET